MIEINEQDLSLNAQSRKKEIYILSVTVSLSMILLIKIVIINSNNKMNKNIKHKWTNKHEAQMNKQSWVMERHHERTFTENGGDRSLILTSLTEAGPHALFNSRCHWTISPPISSIKRLYDTVTRRRLSWSYLYHTNIDHRQAKNSYRSKYGHYSMYHL